ncbi:MAG: flagellar basal body rod protein FlgC [Gammaproteobacteria bacterium]
MPLLNVFDIAGSAMSAQSIRLNVTASNMANIDSIGSSMDEVYRARYPVFETVFNNVMQANSVNAGVRVAGIVESQAPPKMEYQPDHPNANEEGYIFRSNVNVMEEMANMVSASRAYQNNVEIINASKQMLTKTLSLGQ